MPPDSISDYLRAYGAELGDRVLSQFPPLHGPDDPLAAQLSILQAASIPGSVARHHGHREAMGRSALCCSSRRVRHWQDSLISLGSIFTHAAGKPFAALAMVPPQLVEKWARECFLTLPGVRVFVIDGVRNGVGSNGFSGVNEVRFRNGRIVREGLHSSLSDIRLAKSHRSARARWRAQVPGPAVFIVSRERAKLGYFWRHVIRTSASGPFIGNVVNPDTGRPVLSGEDQLRRVDFARSNTLTWSSQNHRAIAANSSARSGRRTTRRFSV